MNTEPETDVEREPLSRGERIILSGVGGVILIFLFLCLGLSFLIETVIVLAIGWVPYLQRTLPGLGGSVSGVLGFLICLALFATGLHLACRWIYQRRSETETVESDWQPRWSLFLVALFLMLVVSSVCLIGASHQLWWMASGEERMLYRGGMTAMRRSVSKNNLKQIGIGMHDYREVHDRFPSGGTVSETGQPQHGWVAQILPYLDHADLYQQIDFHQPWTADVNRRPYETRLYELISPGMMSDVIEQEVPRADDARYQPAHYAANSLVLGINKGLQLDSIKDGAANTILAGEVKAGARAWGSPLNLRDPARGINQSPDGFGSPFTRYDKTGAHILLGDGSVRFVSDHIDPAVLKALSTPAGGEPLSEDWMDAKPANGKMNSHD